mmetsp:Transcript_24155/g.47476  ORF Transcript_24155/g.47476 Transcript_24155/m.47476 type:complete len:96 (-) Transcript_24155:799-1086(-)
MRHSSSREKVRKSGEELRSVSINIDKQSANGSEWKLHGIDRGHNKKDMYGRECRQCRSSVHFSRVLTESSLFSVDGKRHALIEKERGTESQRFSL